ncbi:zinc ribbon domain-containing protein [Nonomuraea sp. NPDC049480]|uniref:zinc ribbon domain-containing protein n=1 Tax=Nonomuraea sp. NPDC049480 TaxID=3364353 RepID=UPI0037B20214
MPSSKLCSVCGAPAERMPPAVREWTCGCGAVHDRDVNAALQPALTCEDGRGYRDISFAVRPPGAARVRAVSPCPSRVERLCGTWHSHWVFSVMT